MDIPEYLKRLNYQGSLEPTLETLQALHEAHLLTVPFENLSIHYEQPIILRVDLLYNKVVRQRRGGFCYELNGLFVLLLRELGFKATLLSASMAHQTGIFGPEIDHPTILVHLADDWLTDVGNGDSFRLPLRLSEGEEIKFVQGEHTYRLVKEPTFWTLQKCASDGIWQAEYRFTMQPHDLTEFSEMCQFYQTSPESPFTHGRVCSLATTNGRITLRDLRLITTNLGERTETLLGSEEEYAQVLKQTFGVRLS